MLTPRSATQAELDNLITMAASGVLSSTHNGKTVSFANMAELRERIDYLVGLNATTADRPRVTYARRRAD